MKVLYFTPFYPPQGEAAATRAYWFVKVLKEAGHEVSLLNASEFTLRPASNKAGSLIRLLKENLTGIELLGRIVASKTDLVILSSPPFFTVLWGALGAGISGKKYILDIRDLYPEVFFELKIISENSPLGSLAKKMTSYLYRNAKAIMTVTQGLCSEIARYGQQQPILVMNGYDPEIFYPGKPEEKFQKFTLIFHGNLGRVQNIDTLLNLAQKLENDDLEILVAGEGPKAQEILKANRKNVKYLGNIAYQDIPKLLRKCHVGLSFRTDDKIGKEAFPVKVFEYVGCKIPVIMSPTGEAGNIIKSFSLGESFENSEIDKMAEAIRSIKSNVKFDSATFEQFSRRNQSEKLLSIIGSSIQ